LLVAVPFSLSKISIKGVNVADTVLQTSVKGESEALKKGQFLSDFP
jgi:hypothetical protein